MSLSNRHYKFPGISPCEKLHAWFLCGNWSFALFANCRRLTGRYEKMIKHGHDPDAQVHEMQEEVLRVVDFLFSADRPLVDSCAQVKI